MVGGTRDDFKSSRVSFFLISRIHPRLKPVPLLQIIFFRDYLEIPRRMETANYVLIIPKTVERDDVIDMVLNPGGLS